MTRPTALLLLAVAPALTAAAADKPTYQVELGGRDACVTPVRQFKGVTDAGSINVQSLPGGVLAVRMSGMTAGISYLGCTSDAIERFHLVQEFEVTCSDPKASRCSLTLDSALVGYLATNRKGESGVRLAGARISPACCPEAAICVSHPTQFAASGGSRQCNPHLPPATGPAMPLGRYVLVADFVIEASAGGICNARAIADFSSSGKMPSEWVATRDPFQNTDKAGFGFFVTVTAAEPRPGEPASSPSPPAEAPPPPPSALPPVPTRPAVGPASVSPAQR